MGDYTGPNTGAGAGASTTGSVDMSQLLNWGDIFSAATVSAIEYSLGTKPTASSAGIAVAISSLSRIISTNFEQLSSLGGNVTDELTKDMMIVAILNVLVATMQKKNATKALVVGTAGDVLSDRALIMLGIDPAKSLFQSKKQYIFNLKNKIHYIINYVV